MVALTRKLVANLQTLRNHWGPEQDAAFIEVKELLTSAPVLHFPQYHKPFIIHVDTSDCGVGAFLAQKEDDEELAIIAYFSKRLTSSQHHYSATPKECLAVVLAVTHWGHYIWGRHLVCVTDHSALRYLYPMPDTSNMLTRWAIALQSYDFTVEHKQGKLNIIPDTLLRLFNFEHSEMRVAPHLAPIRSNVPDNPALHGPPRPRPYLANMLTRWAIALQSYDFTVEHKQGKLNIIPDTLSRLFNFEHSEMRVAPHLAPIRRNVPDNPALHGPPRSRPYLANMLTRWAIALQSYDFTVEHKQGKLNIIPDTLSRLFNFEHSEMRVAPHLAPIRSNVPDNPALHGPPRSRPYLVN